MKSIMAQTPHDSSFSFSRRHFHWIIARVEGTVGSKSSPNSTEDEEILGPAFTASDACTELPPRPSTASDACTDLPPRPRSAVARIRSVLTAAFSGRPARSAVLGARLLGTLYGPRRGKVRFAFQKNPHDSPALIFELEIPTGSLVKEMASGVVRVALECERRDGKVRLVEERQWRAYCNGRKCGSAVRANCGAGDWRVVRAVEPVTMGAGVLPAEAEEEEGEGEVMYMRARFERVVGSKDSEAFYMINAKGNGGGSELSIYFLRV
ncbi:protein MIZU-KUSSEI 1-like [Phalaenopsis equestris]|uniref:protein MIZU-KUSSEI 1-like n=1 Tax=Phalaenopsis equestris TaxID=78828 RepID=UPI0009E2F0C0|nr:protein MIZU-KUSSEI 1-like [Phalaenopsis equestris]